MLNVPVLVNNPLLSEPLSVKLPAFVAVAASKLVAVAVALPPMLRLLVPEIAPNEPLLVFVKDNEPPLRSPMMLDPAPAIPTEPPLIPVNVAVPPMLSVPVLNTVPNTRLLDTTVKPLPLKLVTLVVPLAAL